MGLRIFKPFVKATVSTCTAPAVMSTGAKTIEGAAATAKKFNLAKLQEIIGCEVTGVRNGIAITKPQPMPWNDNVMSTGFYRVTQNGDNLAVEFLKSKKLGAKLDYLPLGSQLGYPSIPKNARFARQRSDFFPFGEGRVKGTTRFYDENSRLIAKENCKVDCYKLGTNGNIRYRYPSSIQRFDYETGLYSRSVETTKPLGNGTKRGGELGTIQSDGNVNITSRYFC